jgi:hypothetical protein
MLTNTFDSRTYKQRFPYDAKYTQDIPGKPTAITATTNEAIEVLPAPCIPARS